MSNIQQSPKTGSIYKSTKNTGWRVVSDSAGNIISTIKAPEWPDNPFPGTAHSETLSKHTVIEIAFEVLPEPIKEKDMKGRIKTDLAEKVFKKELYKEEIEAIKILDAKDEWDSTKYGKLKNPEETKMMELK